MALRLIEMVLREKDGEEVRELFKEHKVVEHRQVRFPDGQVLVRILLNADQSEPVLDLLEQRYAGGEGNRAVILPVEATLPRAEPEPTATSGQPPTEDKSPERISREELYEDIQDAARCSRVYLAMAVTLVGAFRVNVRSAPEIRDETVVTSLMAGTQLPLKGKDGDWYQVSLPELEDAWVHVDFARPGPPHPQLVIIPRLVRIRESADLQSPILARAASGLILQRLDRSEKWFRVRLPHPEGLEGWIREDLVEATPVTLALQPSLDPGAQQSQAVPAEPKVLKELYLEPTELEKTASGAASRLPGSPDSGAEGLVTGSNLKLLLSVLLGWSLFIAFVAFGCAFLLPAGNSLRRG